MIWAFILIVGITIVFTLTRGRKSAGRTSTRIGERVEAYMKTIRRTNTPSHYDQMSDTELTDILTAAAQKLHAARHMRLNALMITGALTFALAIFIGAEHGLQGFGITAVVGVIVAYGVNLVLERRTRDWFNENDLDADRLAVE